MATYEVIGTDLRGQEVLLGEGESADVALGQLRAAMRTGLPVHTLFVRIDGLAVNEEFLEHKAREEGQRP